MGDFGSFAAGATRGARLPHQLPQGVRVRALARGREGAPARGRQAGGQDRQGPGDLPELEHVVVLAGEAKGAITLADLRERGAADGAAVARERTAAVWPEDTATIVYTSGTTGPPKGCVLSHANLLYTADAYIDRLELRGAPPVIFQYLPLAHVLPRGWSPSWRWTRAAVLAFSSGDTKKIAGGDRSAAPTVPTVPLLEKVHTRVVGQAAAAGGAKAAIFTRALATRREGRQGQARGPQGRPAGPPAPQGRRQAGPEQRSATALGAGNPVLITGAAPIARRGTSSSSTPAACRCSRATA